MPDRYYNQLNGKTADENYREEKQKRLRLSKKKMTLETFVIGLMRACLEESLREIMKEIIPKS